MLDALKKKLGIAEEAKPEQKELNESMVLNAAEMQSLKTDLTAQQEKFAALSADLASMSAKATSLEADLDKAKSALAQVQKEKEELVVSANKSKMESRKSLITQTIGEAKAVEFLSATESLDDSAFQAVVQALGGKLKAEANTSLFKEVGVDAKADNTVAEVESDEAKALKEKYTNKK